MEYLEGHVIAGRL